MSLHKKKVWITLLFNSEELLFINLFLHKIKVQWKQNLNG